jgi:3-hexulose-6-phosphate synthase/6-phospho-3-hexuloisomerase
MAKIGVEAGVDWLEIGTPLIVCEGLNAISAMVGAFPKHTVLADYKTMDSGGKNVYRTKQHGGHIMTVCANAPDETVKAAVAAGKETGIGVVVDTIGVKNQAARARQCADWGVDMVFLHYGTDERVADSSRDSTQWLDEVLAAVSIPVGVGCFGVEDGVRAASRGADNIVIGHPVISGPNPKEELSRFVREVRANYRPRQRR